MNEVDHSLQNVFSSARARFGEEIKHPSLSFKEQIDCCVVLIAKGGVKIMRLPSTAVFLAVLCVSSSAISGPAEEEHIGKNSITVAYNHEGGDELLKRGGFCAFIRNGESSVIFDVGGEASIILENLLRIDVGFDEVDAVVISHNHWDHVYGLPGVMSGSRTQAPVYVPAPAAAGIHQQFPRATVVPVKEPREIAPGVWTTGLLNTEFMGATLAEQALVLEHPDGLVIVAGCSHPGIVEIVQQAKMMFSKKPIALVAGGFHLRSTDVEDLRKVADDLERLGVRKIAPSHCTGDQAQQLFRERWGKRYENFALGDVIYF